MSISIKMNGRLKTSSAFFSPFLTAEPCAKALSAGLSEAVETPFLLRLKPLFRLYIPSSVTPLVCARLPKSDLSENSV